MANLNRLRTICKQNLLVISMLISVAIAVPLGLSLRGYISHKDYRRIFYLRFPGELFIRMLRMITVPLIVSSLISAVSRLDPATFGKMSVRIMVYFLSTSLLSATLGIILVVTIRPGYRGTSQVNVPISTRSVNPLDSVLDLIRNVFPKNIIEACFQQEMTVARSIQFTRSVEENSTEQFNSTMFYNETVTIEKPAVVSNPGTNMIGLLTVSILFGYMICRLGPKAKALADMFSSLQLITIEIVKLVIWYGPIGTIFLIAATIVEADDPSTVFHQLSFLVLTVMVGLVIHGLIILPSIFYVITRTNPYAFARHMMKAFVTVWVTASSAATIPITMECMTKKAGINEYVAKFVAPLGATVNMDGGALFEATGTIFIAQRIGQDLSIGEIIVISLTATAASIGAAGTPGGSLVAMTMVLISVGLPPDQLALIVAVDWFLGRFRGIVNILGDSYGAGIVDFLSKKELSVKSDDKEEHERFMNGLKDVDSIV